MFWDWSYSWNFLVVFSLWMEIIPPLPLSQDQHTLKHTCKIETGGHNETSSLVYIYPIFLIVLYQFVSSYKLLYFTCNIFQHIFPTISDNYFFLFQHISPFTSWMPSTATPLSLFDMEWIQVLFLSYCLYVLVFLLNS